MSLVHELAERVRKGEPIPFPLGALLLAATPVVRIGMWLRLRQPRIRVNARVISFGNITAGGTGKTPAVMARARAEVAAGKKVAVLTRGYGARNRDRCTLVEADSLSSRWGMIPRPLYERIGDEPALIARNAPGVVIVRCADRVAGARAAIERGCDTLLLDDGYQRVRLERDENILVIDATNPFGNGHLVPRGILREPLSAMTRATGIILTHCDQAGDVAPLTEQLERICPGVPIRVTRHAPKSLWRVADGERLPVDALAGKEVRALCAIGNPESFFSTLEGLGATVVEKMACPDHAAIPDALARSPRMTVCTEKDAVRIQSAPKNLFALGIELEDMT